MKDSKSTPKKKLRKAKAKRRLRISELPPKKRARERARLREVHRLQRLRSGKCILQDPPKEEPK
jgi:hypothetical protein